MSAVLCLSCAALCSERFTGRGAAATEPFRKCTCWCPRVASCDLFWPGMHRTAIHRAPEQPAEAPISHPSLSPSSHIHAATCLRTWTASVRRERRCCETTRVRMCGGPWSLWMLNSGQPGSRVFFPQDAQAGRTCTVVWLPEHADGPPSCPFALNLDEAACLRFGTCGDACLMHACSPQHPSTTVQSLLPSILPIYSLQCRPCLRRT